MPSHNQICIYGRKDMQPVAAGASMEKVTNDIFNVGVNDYDADFFEGQFDLESGMAYNSYLILDDKTAVMDSVGEELQDAWLSNINEVLQGAAPDYLIVQHMEPDHSANIDIFMERYPEAVLITSAKAASMISQFFGTDYSDRSIIVGDGSELTLGKHILHFMTAPMVHWPEVIVTYDETDRVLFSADGFGKFGTTDADEEWTDEAARYYFGIVGKYGANVQALLKKVSSLDIRTICSLHGPVLTGDLSSYINLYDTWSSYRPEIEGVLIAYCSVYGHTEAAAVELSERLHEHGCDDVVLADLTMCDMSEVISYAFRYDRLVLASTTYNGDVFPAMREFLAGLAERGFKSRRIGLLENGSWAPTAARCMQKRLEGCKELAYADTIVKITSALDEASIAQIEALAAELAR